jgi:small GTP-binding protein
MNVKVVLLGCTEVGKTSIANRFTRNLFVGRNLNTTGCDYYIKNVAIDGQYIKLVVHDIGSSVVIRSFRQKYLEHADIVFVVFALDNPATYDIDEFIADIDVMKTRPIVALLGNKVDLVDKNSLDLSSIEATATRLGAPLFLTSAKENIGVSDAIISIVEQFLDTSHAENM